MRRDYSRCQQAERGAVRLKRAGYLGRSLIDGPPDYPSALVIASATLAFCPFSSQPQNMKSPTTKNRRMSPLPVDPAMFASVGSRDATKTIREWQADSTTGGYWAGDMSVNARLCSAVLLYYKEILRYLSKQVDIQKPIRMSLERTYSLMVLWSEAWGVRDGSLDEIFAKSRNIRRSSLKILSSIANALLESRSLFRGAHNIPTLIQQIRGHNTAN